jgi:myotubularin-related protein 1/2
MDGIEQVHLCIGDIRNEGQTVALAEIMLDPFYRTIRGLAIVIEKEFLSFGHKMAQRSGHDEIFTAEEYKDKEVAPIILQVKCL